MSHYLLLPFQPPPDPKMADFNSNGAIVCGGKPEPYMMVTFQIMPIYVIVYVEPQKQKHFTSKTVSKNNPSTGIYCRDMMYYDNWAIIPVFQISNCGYVSTRNGLPVCN